MRARTLNFLFVTLVTTVIALTLGSGLLLRAAVCMAVMLLLALISALLTLFTARILYTGKNFSVQRGRQASTLVQFRFASILPMGSLVYVLDTGLALHFGAFPFAAYTRRLALPTEHVGVFHYGSGTLYITDLFNLFVLSKRFCFDSATMTVLPSSFETPRPENSSIETGAGSVRFSDNAEEPSGIREFMEGDLLKRIHWKLSYKTYDPFNQNVSPLVKTYEEAVRPDILVIPDLTRIEATEETQAVLRDGICEGTLSLCRAVIEGGDTVRLLLYKSVSEEIPASLGDDLKNLALQLARAEFENLVTFDALIGEAMRRAGTTSSVVFVTARLEEHTAEMLLRMKSFSGMNIELMYIADHVDSQVNRLQTRLEAAGISVTRQLRPLTEENV